MAMLLAQSKLLQQPELYAAVIDEFNKSSWLINAIPFHPCVNPSGGGSSWTYTYDRVLTQSVAASRAINSEYVAQEAEVERVSTDLKVLGGAFEIDKLIINAGGIETALEFQLRQKIKAINALFSDLTINGDSAVNVNDFDGLAKAVTGSATDYDATAVGDLSTSAAIDANYTGFLDALDEWLMSLDGTPDGLMGNTKMIAKLRAISRRAGMYQVTKDDFGRQIENYGSIPLIDLGDKAGSSNPIVDTDSNGMTHLYAARFGIDGVHAISFENSPMIDIELPTQSNTGFNVKRGNLNVTAAVVIKTKKSAGVMHGIKVA